MRDLETIAVLITGWFLGGISEWAWKRLRRSKRPISPSVPEGHILIPRHVKPGAAIVAPRGTEMVVAEDGRVLAVHILEHQ